MRLVVSRYHDLADAVIDSVAILAFDPDVALFVHTNDGPHVTFTFLSMTHSAPCNLMGFAARAEPCGAN